MAETAVELIREGKDITTHLTDTEKLKFDQYEQIIKNGLNTFLQVGHALAQIRDNRLYRETHKTFEKYCKDKWDLGRAYAYRQIDSYKTINLLELKMSPIGDKNPCDSCDFKKGMNNRKFKGVKIPGVGSGKCIREGGLCEKVTDPKSSSQIEIILPINEAQTRPLTKLDPDGQVEAWALVLDQLNEGKKLTAALVGKAVKEVQGEVKQRTVKKIKKKVGSTQRVSNLFKKQYQVMLDIITEEQNSGWRGTSQKEAVKHLKTLVTIAESED